MKLNHLNLPVPDVAEAGRFFEQYFGFTCLETKGDHVLAVLTGKDGFSLVLMSDRFNRNGVNDYPDALHIGFLMDDQNEVDQIYTRLKEGNIVLTQEPHQMRGVYGFYFHAPGGILTEVSCLLQQELI